MRWLSLRCGRNTLGLISAWAMLLPAARASVAFTDVQWLTSGELLLRAASSDDGYYRLDVATDLEAWEGWITARGTNQHLDSGARYLGSRFYRAVPLEGTAHLTGDHLPTAEGDAVVHPINHASLVVGWNGLMIYVDPVGASTRYSGLPRADLILVTHDHGDHFSTTTLSAVRGAGAPIIGPPDVYSQLSSLSSGSISLPNGVTTNLLGLSVQAVPAYNSRHTLGDCNSYVVTLGGRRLFFSGDTGDVAEMRALSDIDMAFLCMNVPFTMTVQQAASAVRDFQPRMVYPYHYRNQDNSFADLALFKQLVGFDQGVEVRLRAWY